MLLDLLFGLRDESIIARIEYAGKQWVVYERTFHGKGCWGTSHYQSRATLDPVLYDFKEVWDSKVDLVGWFSIARQDETAAIRNKSSRAHKSEAPIMCYTIKDFLIQALTKKGQKKWEMAFR